MIDALSNFQNEQRSVEYVKLDASQAGTIDPPSPETLAGYFDEHKVQFRAPEYRKIIFVPITPEEIGKWSEVSDDDAKKLYEARKDTLGQPEKREVSQIVFPNMDEATAARARLATGRPLRLSELGVLEAQEFGLFLTLLGEALAEQAGPDAAIERSTGDGLFIVRLEPLGPGTHAVIETPAGTFAGRDHRLTVTAAA